MGEEEEAMVSIVALERMKRKPQTGEKYRFLVPTIFKIQKFLLLLLLYVVVVVPTWYSQEASLSRSSFV